MLGASVQQGLGDHDMNLMVWNLMQKVIQLLMCILHRDYTTELMHHGHVPVPLADVSEASVGNCKVANASKV